jgi:hypothetical protein
VIKNTHHYRDHAQRISTLVTAVKTTHLPLTVLRHFF